jgi:drug/metabolite transporter (DMT)-like permease
VAERQHAKRGKSVTVARSIKLKGVLFSVLSAVIFGTSPIFFKTIVATGINTTTQVVLRSIVTMVLAGILARVNRQPILLKGRLLVDALLAFVAGQGLTAILLNSSYAYLPAGMSTSLHFVYPSAVMIACVVLFRERVNLAKVAALLLSVVAIALMTDLTAKGQLTGVFLAVGSGFSYAFYILYLERTQLRDIPVWTFAFWGSLGCLVAAGGLGLSTNTLDVSGATVKGLLLLAIMVPLQSVLAVRFFQLGVRYSGSTAASLLSTMEPVTSAMLGMLILHESMSVNKFIGCGAIVLSVILVVLGTGRSEKTVDSAVVEPAIETAAE